MPSPSSRRAWIEIVVADEVEFADSVALLAEGVDRNLQVFQELRQVGCRPPRGGRG